MRFAARLATTLGRVHRDDTLSILCLYNAVVLVAFAFVYRFYGLRHVDIGDAKPTWGRALYYAGITHFSFTPPGEWPARDAAGRAIILAHALMSWLSLFWVVFTVPVLS